MRDYVLLTLILGSIPFCFARPYLGIYMWAWISYMNPHRLAWSSLVKYFPVGQCVAVATLLGFLFTKDRERLPMEREVVLLLMLWAFYTFTSFFGLSTAVWDGWNRTSKIILFTLLTIVLCLDRQKLKSLLLIIAFSIGFYGIKGAIFSVLTGGDHRVWGPEKSFIEDNNAIGLALLMVMPIFLYITKIEENKKLKLILYASFFGSIISTLFTYSRGALFGLVFLFLALLFKSKNKILAIFIIGIGMMAVLVIVPDKWVGRMQTIKDYEKDGSAMGRINAWYFAWNLALKRPFIGGGFNVSERRIFRLYAPDPNDFHGAHSIYFEVLGEHGFIGLGLFLSLLVSAILSLKKLKKNFRHLPSFSWLCNYCDMIELSLISYMVSGAFLGLAYFDLYYHMIAMVVILKVLAKREYDSFIHEKNYIAISDKSHLSKNIEVEQLLMRN